MTTQVKHFILFDLQVGGHHAGYIRHLLYYWPNKNDKLSLVVSPEFLSKHADVVQMTLPNARSGGTTHVNIEWVTISEEELNWYQASACSLTKHQPLGLAIRGAWVEWRLFCRYAKRLNADQALIMYLDRFQLPLAFRLPIPCELSGIYFRPTFHYHNFSHYQPSFRERLRAWRQALLWRLTCHHPCLKVLFSLDPFAVETLQRFGKTKVVHLPDPVEQYQKGVSSKKEWYDRLAIETGRRVFLLFGALSERKGISKLLDAISLLPVSELTRLCVLLVGNFSVVNEAQLLARIAAISQSLPIQIILHNQFVAEKDVPLYFDITDVVLAPYQYHVGMSGILVWAATLRKPVLASNYGLMGELVRQHSLGIAVDSTQASEIAKGISVFLKGEPTQLFDNDSAAQFAHENEASRFARVVYENL